MNGKVLVTVVPEPYNSFATFRHAKCWTRADAIVADKSGWLQAWIDLLLKGLDIDLVEIYLVTSGLVRICASKSQYAFR